MTTLALVLMGVAGVGGPATGADEPGDPADGRPTITVQEVWEGRAGTGVSIPVTVTGTPAPEVTAADLPPGVALIGHRVGRVWHLTGRVDDPGEYTATLTANNGVGDPAVTTVVFRAGTAPSFTGPSPDGPVPLVVGVPATVELMASGSPVPTVTIEGTLPAGLTIVGDGTGSLTITGTPMAPGRFELTGRATNRYATAALSMLLIVGRQPTFDTDTLTLSAFTDEPFDTRLNVSTDSPARLAVTDGALPPGFRLSVDGWIGGIPTAVGHHEATVTATTMHGEASVRVVVDVWTRPSLADRSGVLYVTTAAETAVSEAFRTVGWPVPSVTLGPGKTLPPGLSLRVDPDDPYAWQIVGEVAHADAGRYVTTLVVANAVGPDHTVWVLVQVTAPPRWDPPAGGTVVVPRAEPMPPLTLRVTGYPLGISYGSYGWSGGDRTDVDLDWDLGADGYARELRMTLVGTLHEDTDFRTCVNSETPDCDGGVQTTTRFVVRDRPVVVAPGAATVHVGTAAAIPPITVTTTHDASLTADGLPDGLTLVPDPGADHTWLITGRPETTAVGRHTVVLTADNGVTGTASIRLDVPGPPSSAAPTAAVLLVGETPTTVVRAAGLPAPAMTVTGDLPDGVTATDDGTGALHLVGAPTRTGTWTVQVHAANEHGSVSTDLTLTVEQAAAFADDTASRTLREGHELSWAPVVVGVPAPVVTLASGELPAGIALTETGALVGTPAVGSADAADGRYDVVLRVVNAHEEDLLPVTLTVLSRPSFPDGLPDVTIQAGSESSVAIRTGGWDRPTVTATGLPPGLEVIRADATTWTLVGTVARADRGSYDVGLVLENGYGPPVTGTLTVLVAAAHAWSGQDAVDVGACVTPKPVDVVLTGYPVGEVTVATDGAAPTIDLLDSGPTLVRYRVGGPPDTTGPASVTFTSDAGADHTVTFRSRCAEPTPSPSRTPSSSPAPSSPPSPDAAPSTSRPPGGHAGSDAHAGPNGTAEPGGAVAAPTDTSPGDAVAPAEPAGGSRLRPLLAGLVAVCALAGAAVLVIRRGRA